MGMDKLMKTPKILWAAVRQYEHNHPNGLIPAFDKDLTIKIVCSLQAKIDELKFAVFKYVDIQEQLITLTGNLWPQNETTEKMGEVIKQYVYPLEK